MGAVMNSVEDLRARVSATETKDEKAKRTAREAFAADYLVRWAGNLEKQIQGTFSAGTSFQWPTSRFTSRCAPIPKAFTTTSLHLGPALG
jgi:hypothetical protein